MAPLRLRQLLLLAFINLTIISALSSSSNQDHPTSLELHGGTSCSSSSRRTRKMLEFEEDEGESRTIIKKKNSSLSSEAKLSKPTTSTPSKDQTKLVKSTASFSKNNQTKLAKPISGPSKNRTKLTNTASDSVEISPKQPIKAKKLNTTSAASTTTKSSTSLATKKSSDLNKLASSKNKTTKPTTATQEIKIHTEKAVPKSKSAESQQKNTSKKLPNWIEDEDDDFISEFRDLPSKFQETFVPDLEKISMTSRVYLTKYNKEIARNFKPYVGNKYAPTIASFASFAFIIIPLILVSLVFHRIKAFFSLQKLLIFIQAYLAIYFTILCLSCLITGLEPLKFFYSTSQSTYVCVQVLQTLAYVLYLVLLLMYLVLVFSTETGLVTKMLGLGQTFVGFSVGLHYYMNVFHRAVLHQPPKSSWKVHGLYATCFIVICLMGRLDMRKKAYFEDGGEEGKKS